MTAKEPLLEAHRQRIYDAMAAELTERHAQQFPFNRRLGAALLGHSCHRYLFYSFRWVKAIEHTGRAMRAFDRGHKSEADVLALLKHAGLVIYTIDPATGEQYRAPDLPAHMGGSMDGVLEVPEQLIPIVGSRYIPVECKSHDQRSATRTFKDDLAAAYPRHYIQGAIYAKSIGAKYFLYVGHNKNNDEIYIEYVEISNAAAVYAVHRGIDVINTHVAASLDRTDKRWECKSCTYQEECKNRKAATAINCRSCQNFFPQQDGTWHCLHHNEIVPYKQEIARASNCNDWVSII